MHFLHELVKLRSLGMPLLVHAWTVACQLVLHAPARVEQLLAHVTYKAELLSAWLSGPCWQCLLKWTCRARSFCMRLPVWRSL